MDYHMQFMEFLSLFKKRGLSYAISGISFASTKMWTIICNFWNFFPLSKNVDYHMQILKFFPFLLKRGLSYVIFGIFFPSPKTWTLICNFWNFFPFSKNLYIICSLWNLFSISKNMGYHMQYLEYFAHPLKRGL